MLDMVGNLEDMFYHAGLNNVYNFYSFIEADHIERVLLPLFSVLKYAKTFYLANFPMILSASTSITISLNL